MTWATRVREAFSSKEAFLKAIETKEVDGENKADFNEDLLPTEPGMFFVFCFLSIG
jgi:NCS1 family nucleobase:cation symporter-1